MRIGLIAPPWAPIPPGLYGGIEQVVDGLARGFQAAGHQVRLFATGDSTCPVPTEWLLERSEGQRMGQTVPELRQVVAAYEALDDCDIVHDHTVAGPLLAALGAFPGHRAVTTLHGELNEELTDLYARIGPKVPVIAVSHAQRKPAPHVPVAAVIHHGVEAAHFPLGAGDGGYALFLGRMTAEKGPHRAIAAARKAGVPLLLAGKMREPLEQQFFEQEVAPHLNSEIRYVGEVGEEQKLRLLAAAAATLFPIRWNEPFGLVMIESLACGTPVLAYPEGAAPEVIEDGRTGFLCQGEGELAEALAGVEELDRRACRDAVEGYFSLDRMVADHLRLFEDILAR